jgi:ATP-binding cassette subfamily B protein
VYRYLLAADDELDDGSERTCDWEDDEDRERLDRQYLERAAAQDRQDVREREAAERR